MIDGSTLQLLKMNIISVDDAQVDTSWKHDNVYGPFHRLWLIKSGEGVLYFDEHDYELKSNHFYLIPGYHTFSCSCKKPIEMHYALFACELPEHFDFFAELPFQYEIPATEVDVAEFMRLIKINPKMGLRDYNPLKYDKALHFHRSLNYANEVLPAVFLESKSILLGFLSRFMVDDSCHKENKHFALHPHLEDVLRFINDHIEEELTVNKLAEKAYLTPNYFSKLFKTTVGVNPIEYIQEKRLDRVKQLLCTAEMSLEQIAAQIGFSSVSYMTRLFKKHLHVTPGQYRKNSLYG